ncbi:MAG: SH3 domain-containing protein [Eubacteriales bacterium]
MRKLVSLILCVLMIVSVFTVFASSANAATSASTAGIVSTQYTSLTVRSSNSTSSAVLTTLPKGSYVTLISKSGSWWYVEYAAGKYGYCYASYIAQDTDSFAAYVNTSYSNLNVRSGAGTSYSIQGSLPKNTCIVVISQSGGWSKILYYGRNIGYVSSSFIKAYTSSSVTYPAISLSVPKYSQLDSRWSSYPIANSTIGVIGCATTSLAMTESYRTGTTIYPNEMASKLTYTSGGAVYWPSNYVWSTSSNYLQNIYSQLKLGKPVIVAASKSSGGTHFVVVTGYTGGSYLSASGFTINDAGSRYRTDLQDLFNDYPTFYKIIYYN